MNSDIQGSGLRDASLYSAFGDARQGFVPTVRARAGKPVSDLDTPGEAPVGALQLAPPHVLESWQRAETAMATWQDYAGIEPARQPAASREPGRRGDSGSG